jgi:hypothetical protein
MEVRDKFDLSRIVIRIVLDDRMICGRGGLRGKTLNNSRASYILYNLSLCKSIVYYFIFLVMNL